MYKYGQPVGYQEIALGTVAASGLTLPGDTLAANAALIRVETANARWRCDGTPATTGTTGGMPILTSDTQAFFLQGKGVLLNFSAIAQTGTSNLHVLYFAVSGNE